jgi:hypothetical protein
MGITLGLIAINILFAILIWRELVEIFRWFKSQINK